MQPTKSFTFKEVLPLFKPLDELIDYLEKERANNSKNDLKSKNYLIESLIPEFLESIKIINGEKDKETRKLRIKYASVDDKGRIVTENLNFVYTPENLLKLEEEVEQLENKLTSEFSIDDYVLESIKEEMYNYPIQHQLTLRNIIKLFNK